MPSADVSTPFDSNPRNASSAKECCGFPAGPASEYESSSAGALVSWMVSLSITWT